MRGKAGLVVGLAAGYVLGARDGRERYEQIKAQATRVAHDPRVQAKTSQAADLAKDKAPLVKDKFADATSKVTGKVSGGGSHEHDDTVTSATTSSTGTSGTATTGTGTTGTGTSGTGKDSGTTDAPRAGTSSETGSVTDADEDVIVITAPPPGPLDPAPTPPSDSNPLEGQHG